MSVTESNKHTNPAKETQSYFGLIRRLNLLRQVADFREKNSWDSAGALLERTGQFFRTRGSVPYHFDTPTVLSKYTSGQLLDANVFFGPTHSGQIVIFVRQSDVRRYSLVHVVDGVVTEYTDFPLDKRFGSNRRATVVNLYGSRPKSAIDRYLNPVEFSPNDESISIQVNVLLSGDTSDPIPAQLVGTPDENGYQWSVTRLGVAHDWYPDTNPKLFLPGYEPRKIVYGLSNARFICAGVRNSGRDGLSWAVWNDRWDVQNVRPLIRDIVEDCIGAMAVSDRGEDRTVYSVAIGKLPDEHPLASQTPALFLARNPGQVSAIPLEGIADIRNVLAIHVAGPESGIFHATRQGPTEQLAVYQNGVPVGAPLDGVTFHGMTIEDPYENERIIRAHFVVSDEVGRRLLLASATSTAWPETFAMMGVPLETLRTEIAEQETALESYRRRQSGSSTEVLGLDQSKQHLEQTTVHGWWRHICRRIERVTGTSTGPYISRVAAARLLEMKRDAEGKRIVEPLCAPLADIFHVDVEVAGGLAKNDDVIRLRREISTYFEKNGLLVRASSITSNAKITAKGDPVLLVVHPGATTQPTTSPTE